MTSPRGTAPARKAAPRARSKPTPKSDRERLRDAIDALAPGERSTAEQRRELYLGALRRAEELAYGDYPGSVQVTAVKELRTITEKLAALDLETKPSSDVWAADVAQLEAR